ncbi:MAG: hypothetical protein CFE44_11980 [Burkholderiales bacterium PBB4]|nr:MAG: hypothetical protein CFE44_11980 [Burkholderiales bacterium PBB4]
MTASETALSLPPLAASGARQLLLVGAGRAHRQLLAWLAEHPLTPVQISLITPHSTQWYPARLPAFVAGRVGADDCQMTLEALVQRSGVHWLQSPVRALDASRRTLTLDDGRTRTFDWISLNSEAQHDRDLLEQSLPGSREHALFVSPLYAFGKLWPQVCGLAEKRALRFTVVGAGATGTELALALQSRFADHSVTLLTDASPPCPAYSLAVQARVMHTLKQRGVTVLQDTALEISADTVQLACGAALASDVTLVATPTRAPHWAHTSGLALCAEGLIAIDNHFRSTSHPWVFAVGDIARRQPAAPRARDASASKRAGLELAERLKAVVEGQSLPQGRPAPSPRSWTLLDLGQGQAIASRGGWTLHGRWVGAIKTWLDNREIARVNAGLTVSR